ncbi:MAG: ribosome maturation factor RimM [Gammaproteobacteria bacterium]
MAEPRGAPGRPAAGTARAESDDDPLVVVGRISGAFGTRGWIKVLSFTRPRDNLLEYAPWLVGRPGAWREYALRDSRRHHGALVAKLDGIDDRDQAAALARSDIAVPRSAFAPADAGEYYWSDLVGLRVINSEGVELGRVAGMLETGAHDVIRVAGERERLIPFVQGVFVLEVDLDGGCLRVDWHVDD